MPLFKRRPQRDAQPAGDPSDARLLSEEQLLKHLQEEIDGREAERPLVVLGVVAQALQGERLRAGEMDLAASALVHALRGHDVVCVLGEGALVAVLSADEEGARVIAHRLAADLTMKSHGVVARKWLTGEAVFPRDGKEPQALVQSAIDQAR